MQVKVFLTISLFFLLLTGCSKTPTFYKPATQSGSPTTLGQLQKLKATSSSAFGDTAISDTVTPATIRTSGLKDSAMSVGAQAGLAWRAKQINDQLEKQDALLRQVFNFNALLLHDNVLPPVLGEGRDTLKLDDPNTIRLADRTYKIISQARFVTATPVWRDYLILHFKEPERPDNTLLPVKKERKLWNHYVAQGWHEGIQQANTIYDENLARLKRDFKGMALYRSLLSQGMVSMPYVAKANLGITGGGENMRINDQVLRITALPALQPNARQWKPALSPTPPDNPIKNL